MSVRCARLTPGPVSVVLAVLIGWSVFGTFSDGDGAVLHVLAWVIGRGPQDRLRAAAASLVAGVAGSFEHVPALRRGHELIGRHKR